MRDQTVASTEGRCTASHAGLKAENKLAVGQKHTVNGALNVARPLVSRSLTYVGDTLATLGKRRLSPMDSKALK